MKKLTRTAAAHFQITGRISTDDDQGVYGLTVVAYDKDLLFDDRLGKAVTGEDGTFRLFFGQSDFSDIFEARPDVFIEIFDCTGARIASTENTVKWQAGKEQKIDASVPRQKLENHLSSCRPLLQHSGGLIEGSKLGLIEEALDLLQFRIDQGAIPPLSRVHGVEGLGDLYPHVAAYCPAPDILGFADILDDAWGVLFDDPRARDRFQDILDTIFHRVRVRAPDVAKAMARDWAADRPMDDSRFSRTAADRLSYLGAVHEESLLDKDRLFPVVLAAFRVAGDDHVAQNRNVGIVLGQIGGLVQFDRVYRAACGALTSNPGLLPGFADIVGHVGGTCGPDCGPVPFPPHPDHIFDLPDIASLEMLQCAHELGQAMRSGALSGGSYEILTADFGDGCPGDTVVLTGTGFSGYLPERNRVVFTHQNGGTEFAEAAPATPGDWTDTRIEVTIPPDAGPGPVHLAIVGNFATACGRHFTPMRSGDPVPFEGGAAHIRRFTGNHRSGEFSVAPGETVRVRWLVVPPAASVHLTVERDGIAIVDEDVTAEGFRDIGIPAGTRSQTVATLTTSNSCPGTDTATITIHGGLRPNLEIVGMELTQSIQYYRASDHLTDDPADPDDPHDQPDNSIPMVIGKPALLRVYARSGLPVSYEGGRVTAVGTLDIERIEHGTATTIATLSALPRTIEADYPVYDDERRDLNCTLNFLIPAAHMSGQLRLTATIRTASGFLHDDATDELSVHVALEQTLQVAGIMVSYNGPPFAGAPAGTPNIVLAAPGLADLITTATHAIDAFPVRADSATTFRIGGTHTQTDHLQDPMLPPGSGCSVNWNALMADLRAAATLDAATAVGNWVYYGLLPTGIPLGTPPGAPPGVKYVSGCGGNGVGTGEVGAGWTMAHEVGHALHLRHVNCNGDEGNPDPDYPAYGPYDPGSIGEYGFEFTGAMTIHSPLTTVAVDGAKDFMSYCADEWISPYHYNRLLNVGLLSPVTTPGSPSPRSSRTKSAATESQPLISIIGYIDAEDVQVHSVSRFQAKQYLAGGTLTDLTAELLDETGTILSSGPVYSFPVEGPGQINAGEKCGCRPLFQVFLQNKARGSMLRILRGQEVLWRRAAPEKLVSIREIRVEPKENGHIRLEWSADIADDLNARASVRWSTAGQEDWHSLAVGIAEDFAELSIAQMPGGSLVFEVMVDDGFDTASAKSAAVDVPHSPPTAAILAPRGELEVQSGEALRLWGACIDETGKALPEDSCVWHLDGQHVGSGTDLIIEAPGPGEHKLSLSGTDKFGTTEVTGSFVVGQKT